MFHLTTSEVIVNEDDTDVTTMAWLAGPKEIEAGQLTVFTFGAGVSEKRGIKIQILFFTDIKDPFPLLPQLVTTTIVPQAKMIPNFFDRLKELNNVMPEITKYAETGAKSINATLGMAVGAAGSIAKGSITAVAALGENSAAASAKWEQRTITVPCLGWALGFEWRIDEEFVETVGNGIVGYATFVFPFPGKSHLEVRAIVRPHKEKDPFKSPYVIRSTQEPITVTPGVDSPMLGIAPPEITNPLTTNEARS